jgi:hypothetical protein
MNAYRELFPILVERLSKHCMSQRITTPGWKLYTPYNQADVQTINKPSSGSDEKEATTTESLKSFALTDWEEFGIQVLARYADQIGIGSNNQQLITKLKEMISTVHHAYYPVTPKYIGFDWFAGILSLLFGSSPSIMPKNTLHFFAVLQGVASLEAGLYLWPTRCAHITQGDITPLYSTTMHLVETILELELPQVASAFTLSGCTPSQVLYSAVLFKPSFITAY